MSPARCLSSRRPCSSCGSCAAATSSGSRPTAPPVESTVPLPGSPSRPTVSLTVPERELARETFLRLADEGPDSPVRRRVPLAQLPDADVVETLAGRAARHRQRRLRRDRPRGTPHTLAAAARLARGGRERAAPPARARGQAETWEAGGRESADLYRGARLAAAVEWASRSLAPTRGRRAGVPRRVAACGAAHASSAAGCRGRACGAARARDRRGRHRVRATAVGPARRARRARRATRRAGGRRASTRPRAPPRARGRPARRHARHAAGAARDAAAEPGAPRLVHAPGTGTRPYRVAVSPDGRTLVVGDSDGALRLFDTHTEARDGAPLRSVFGFLPSRLHARRDEARRGREPAARTCGARRWTLGRLRPLPLDRRFRSRQGGRGRAARGDATRRVLRVRPRDRPAGRRGPGIPRPARPRDRPPDDGSARLTRRRRRRARRRPPRHGHEPADRDLGPADAAAAARGAHPDPARRLRGRRPDRPLRDRLAHFGARSCSSTSAPAA